VLGLETQARIAIEHAAVDACCRATEHVAIIELQSRFRST
jgi:hypothetical protein